MLAVIVRPLDMVVVAAVFMSALLKNADGAGSPTLSLIVGVPKTTTQFESDPFPNVSSRTVVAPPPWFPSPIPTPKLHATIPAATTNAPATAVIARMGPPDVHGCSSRPRRRGRRVGWQSPNGATGRGKTGVPRLRRRDFNDYMAVRRRARDRPCNGPMPTEASSYAVDGHNKPPAIQRRGLLYRGSRVYVCAAAASSFDSAVVGSMVAATSRTRSAGKPPRLACSRISSASREMYTQMILSSVTKLCTH